MTSDAAFIIGWSVGLPVIGVLLSFLWHKHQERAWERERALVEMGWRGSGFDAAALKPRLEEVRRDPLTAAQHKDPVGYYFHVALLASVREAVAHSAYFEQKESENQPT